MFIVREVLVKIQLIQKNINVGEAGLEPAYP
jgi:hypothetical protein